MSSKQERYRRKVRKETEPMFETTLTVVGHIVNDLQRRKVGDQEVIKFRVASNSRRRTGEGSWESGNSLFINVNCWGRLVTGVGAALGKGAPVIVVGHVYTSEYEDRDGNRRSSLEMRATSVGPDVSRAIVRIERPGYTGPTTDAATIPRADAAAAAGEDTDAQDSVESDDAAALPLSA